MAILQKSSINKDTVARCAAGNVPGNRATVSYLESRPAYRPCRRTYAGSLCAGFQGIRCSLPAPTACSSRILSAPAGGMGTCTVWYIPPTIMP